MKQRLKTLLSKREATFAKRMISRILNWSLIYMGYSYVLATISLFKYENVQVLETLSSTVASTIIGAAVSYLCTSVIEKISEYGTRINGTAMGSDELRERRDSRENIDKDEEV